MPGTPHQNGVAKRRNHRLKDMIKSMIAHITLPESLWSKILKTVICLLNRVLSKIVIKTSYELWIEKSFSIRHLHVWGFPAEPRSYIPYKKFHLRTISYLFV